MNAIAAIIKGLLSAILEWWQGQADKPTEITKAETPKSKLDAWQDQIDEFKRRKDEEQKPK